MASTFSLKSDAYEGRYMQLTCTQRKDNEKSYIDWTLSSVGGEVNYYSTGPTTVIINGTQVYYKARVAWEDKVFPAKKGSVSGTIEVEHDADGSKTIPVSLTTVTYYNASRAKTYSGDWTLDPVPRGARFTATPDEFTNKILPTITYTNPLGDRATRVDVCIADSEGYYTYAPYRDLSKTGTSYTFMPEDIAKLNNKMPKNSTELKVMFVIRTTTEDGKVYSDGKASTFVMMETEETAPSVSASFAPVNPSSVPSSLSGLYIQGKTRVKATITATGKFNATISDYSLSIGADFNSSNANTVTSGVLTSASNVTVISMAGDTRGFSGSDRGTIFVNEYSKPLVIPIGSENAILCYRSDDKGAKKGNSDTVWIKAKRSYYNLGSENKCALQWRRKRSAEVWNDNDHKWDDLISKTTTSTDEYDALVSGEFIRNESYSVQIRTIDDLGEFDIRDFEIPTQDVALHLGRGGKNVTVGDYCDYTEDYTFRSAWKAKFDNGIYGNVYGTMTQQYVEDMLAFAEGCPQGFTPFFTGGSTTNIPTTGNYAYASGFVNKRSDSQITVVIFSYYSGDLAINTYYDTAGGWLGWRYLHTTTT